jgi:ubiquinol oxidase
MLTLNCAPRRNLTVSDTRHLLTFLSVHKPSLLVRSLVLLAQGVMTNGLFLTYLIAPRWVHRFVGYLEQEAVHTYTNCIKDIDSGVNDLGAWRTAPAPKIAITYWRLAPDATVRDVVMAVRADEAIHRDVNHVFASIKDGERNPFE